jgi:peroxiredoxin
MYKDITTAICITELFFSMAPPTQLPPHLVDILAQSTSTREKFQALRMANRRRGPHVEEAADRFVQKLRLTFATGAIPEVGERFPNFVLPNQSGELVDRDGYLLGRPSIISFNRGHWCLYCMLELSIWGRAYPRIEALACPMVSIVPERGVYARALQHRSGIAFPVLCDVDNGLGMSLGLVVALSSDLRGHFYNRNDNIGLFQGNAGWILPVPATFVLDGDGIICARFVDPDYRTRMDPDDAIRCVESLLAA